MTIHDAYTDKDCDHYFKIEIHIRINIHDAYTDKDSQNSLTVQIDIPQHLQ